MRRKQRFKRAIRRTALPALLLTAFVVVPVASGGPFTDPAGDNGGAPDVNEVVVSSDARGKLQFAIRVGNRSALDPGDGYLVLLDSDRRAQTGEDGLDHVLILDGQSGQVSLGRWNGSSWVFSTPGSLSATWDGGPVISLHRASIRYSGAMRFVVGALTGETVDAAPNNGMWTYRVAGSCTIVGTTRGETLVGSAFGDVLCGLGGNDRIRAGAGADLVNGGPGRDTLAGEAGADRIMARDGARDSVDGGSGRDRVRADRADRVRNVEGRF